MAPVFWADPAIGQSPGDLLNAPYLNQVDTITDETTRVEIRDDARSLFPFFDGDANLLPERPADFANPTPESFLNWHSAHQLEYLRAQGPISGLATSAAYRAVLGAASQFDAVYDFPAIRIPAGDPLGTGPGLYAILSADGTEVIVINQLRPDAIAMLGGFTPGATPTDTEIYSAENQRRLRLMPAFAELVARPFNLVPSSVDPATITLADATTNNAARTSIQGIVQGAINVIEGVGSFVATTQAEFDADLSLRQTRYHYLFTEQLNILNARLDRMEIFDQDAITLEVNKILERFERVEAYKGVTEPQVVAGPAPGTPNYGAPDARGAANSTDGLETVNSAGNILIGTELRLIELLRATEGIATSQRYEGRFLDAPMMTFLLQSFTNYSKEAEAEAEAEDLKQHNKLLEDYTKFQTLLNTTLQAYDPVRLAASRDDDDDNDDPESLGLKGSRYDRTVTPTFDPYSLLSSFTPSEQILISMFDRGLATMNGNSFHPVEALKGLDRPLEDLTRAEVPSVFPGAAPFVAGGVMIAYDKNTWDKLAVNVSETTKLISQDTQIRMNEINQLNKEKNRHYELASSSLNRLSGILRSINEV